MQALWVWLAVRTRLRLNDTRNVFLSTCETMVFSMYKKDEGAGWWRQNDSLSTTSTLGIERL